MQAQIAAQPDNGPATSTRNQATDRALQPGQILEREIKPGERHSYFLEGIAGTFTQIDIDQRGSNVGLSLFGVDGKLILSLNGTDDVEGNERIPVLTDASGVYRIVVRSLDRGSEPGRYELKVSQTRAATPQDKDYAAAEMLIQEARRLLVQRSEQSKRSVINKYREALPLLRSTGNREREATVLSNIAATAIIAY